MTDGPRERLGNLLVQLLASATLPILGVTKIVETIVSTGNTLGWLLWTTISLGLYAVGDDLAETVDDATDADLDANDGTTG